jgi:HPt (histidine-containing phosphotransfer) domain-containing protein
MSLAPSGDVLDQRVLDALRAFGRDPGKLLAEMVRDFVLEAPSLVTAIGRAVEHDDREAAARAAHRLKGMSGHIGARRLAMVAGEIESSVGTNLEHANATAVALMCTELELAASAASDLCAGYDYSLG